MKNLGEENKYALREIGRHVKENRTDEPEEERGFDYIRSNFRYLKNYKSEDEKLRKESFEKLKGFFGDVAKMATREADAIELPKKSSK